MSELFSLKVLPLINHYNFYDQELTDKHFILGLYIYFLEKVLTFIPSVFEYVNLRDKSQIYDGSLPPNFP